MVFCLLTAACFGVSTASTRRYHSCCVCDASAAHYAVHILLPAECCNFTIACSARSATWCHRGSKRESRQRRFAEAVAFLGGHREEHAALTRDFLLVLANQLRLIVRQIGRPV